MRRFLPLTVAGLGALSIAGAAQAAMFDFSYSFPTSDTTDFPSGRTSASGVFTATDQMNGSFLVTNVSGQWNGETITGVSPRNTEGDNDNLIFPNTYPVLDESGVTFSVAGPIKGDAGYGTVDVYSSPADGIFPAGYSDSSTSTGSSPIFNLAPASAAPEPASWALMMLGVGLAGAALRRKPHGGLGLRGQHTE